MHEGVEEAGCSLRSSVKGSSAQAIITSLSTLLVSIFTAQLQLACMRYIPQRTEPCSGPFPRPGAFAHVQSDQHQHRVGEHGEDLESNTIARQCAPSPRFMRCLLASGCQAFELRLALGRTWNQALHLPYILHYYMRAQLQPSSRPRHLRAALTLYTSL